MDHRRYRPANFSQSSSRGGPEEWEWSEEGVWPSLDVEVVVVGMPDSWGSVEGGVAERGVAVSHSIPML